jgi:hypothetical protein
MAKPTTVPIRASINEEIEAVKRRFHAAGMKITSNEALVGALILAAREFPPQALIPYVNEFWKIEASESGTSSLEEA